MPPKIPASSPEALATFEAIVPTRPGIVRKPMFGQPAAFYGGRMFCGVFGDGIAVRLSDPDLAAAMKAPGITPFEPMAGRAMTGWVMLTAPVVARRAVSARWVDRAWNWVQTAPPKGPRPSRPRTGSRAK